MLVLVTGGAGFIGSNIVDSLLSKGHSVRILDDISTGRMENTKHLEGKIEIISGSISDKKTVDGAVEGVEYIFHEAAQTSVVDSIKYPAKTWDVNIKGTKLLLNAAVKNNVKKVILASSANIYGSSPKLPKKEDMNVKTNSPYGNSKLMNEIMAKKYYEDDGLGCICLRYFNVYGPRQNPESGYSGVISKFIGSMVNGKSPLIFGDGKQTRDFIYVEDVVRANMIAMKSKIGYDIFNVATGKETSINEIVDTLNDVLGTKLKPNYDEERMGDIRRSVADVSKAKKILGFEAKYSLKEGLKRTVEWYKKSKK